jgi:hypothetical protein
VSTIPIVTDVSPFPYQGPLEPEQVAGREALVADVAERLVDHRVTALLGPRRYGKTSLLRRVLHDLEQVGPTPVWFDLYAVTSMADFAARLDRGLDAVRGPLRRRLTRVASTVSVNLGAVRLDVRGRGGDADPAVVARSLVDVLVGAAEHEPVVAVFDEFAGIANVEGADAVLRTGLQHHYRKIGIVFAGSEPSMMRMLFTDPARAFYQQADLVEIGPLSTESVAAMVDEGFEATKRHAGVVADRVAAFAGGHPQRSMQLADAAWRRTEEGQEATDDTWSDALDAVRAAVAEGLERLHTALPASQQKVLRALAHGQSIFGTAARAFDLSKGTATGARDALRDTGHVHRLDDGRYEIVDPLFADWLRRRFPT